MERVSMYVIKTAMLLAQVVLVYVGRAILLGFLVEFEVGVTVPQVLVRLEDGRVPRS
jgi:hypothetical protein